MEALVDKLIDLTRHHSEEMANQWCSAVKTNPRTPSFHDMPAEDCIHHAIDFYKNMRLLYYSKSPYNEVKDYFEKYAKKSIENNVPLHEAVYALTMLRRHLWLYADFQKPFLTGLDKHQIAEAINMTIRIFDHGTYLVIKMYESTNPRR